MITLAAFVICLTVFLASLLTLFSGFGLGTILMPVAAIFFPISVAVALTAFVHLLNNLFKLGLLWRQIHWPVVLRFGLPAMAAAVPGAWLLTSLSSLPEVHSYMVLGLIKASITPVKLTVGFLLIFFATLELVPIFKNIKISKHALPLGGVLSGFFGGLSGHQGAFRSAFLVRAGLDKNKFVASNAAIASLIDMTRLAVYGMNTGLLLEVNSSLLGMAAGASFVGVLAGTLWLKKVTIGFIQKLVAVALYILGALLVAGLI